MRVMLGARLLLTALPLTACAHPLPNPPTSMQPLGTFLTNHPPESSNSLPPGAQVLAPLTPIEGQLNTVPIGPNPGRI